MGARREFLFVLIVTALLSGGASIAGPPGVPCRDFDGNGVVCPDLRVDPMDLATASASRETFSADSCAVQEGLVAAGERTLLRFGFATPNLGDGDLIVGHPEDHPQWFEWAECHAHYHFQSFATYRFWTPAGYDAWRDIREQNPGARADDLLESHPELVGEFAQGRKVSFCMVDSRPYLPQKPPQFQECSRNQGITAGWGDYYSPDLDGQWVDITDWPGGVYYLEGEVNPDRFITESRYDNNWVAMPIVVPDMLTDGQSLLPSAP